MQVVKLSALLKELLEYADIAFISGDPEGGYPVVLRHVKFVTTL